MLSLGSAAVFEFRSSAPKGGAADASPPVASLLLPPRGLLVFAGEAYTKLLHGIHARRADDLAAPGLVRLDGGGGGGEAQAEQERFLPRGHRLSLTIRRTRRPGEA